MYYHDIVTILVGQNHKAPQLSRCCINLGTGRAWDLGAEQWAEKELREFQESWKAEHEGDELDVVTDKELTTEDVLQNNLILFGDPGRTLCWLCEAIFILWMHLQCGMVEN